MFILEELENIINDAINRLEKGGRIKNPHHKEALKFESTAFVFWLFLRSNTFPSLVHKLILDEMHNQYFLNLKKHGYDRNSRQAVCDDFNLRYKIYNKFADDTDDFVRIGTNFARFVSERSKTDFDAMEIMIPCELIEPTTQKINEFREVIN